MSGDPSDYLVNEATRAFEQEDEQMFPGAGRGPTPAEADAADAHGAPDPAVARSYEESLERGAHQRGEGRIEQ